MAMGVTYVCTHCQHAIEAWDDGNPYYLDEAGVKQYAYHPDHENLERCIGNDSPHLCLACGAEFMVDSEAPLAACPKCHAEKIADSCALEGQRCPYCQKGEFKADPGSMSVS